MTLIIPYTSAAIYWHLHNNVMGINKPTMDKIVEQCNLVNMGEILLTDEIAPGTGVTVAEMLTDLQIDFDDNAMLQD